MWLRNNGTINRISIIRSVAETSANIQTYLYVTK